MPSVRILVDQSGYELLNLGDIAMLQACVRRLSQQWPQAEVMVLVQSAADLAAYCPDAIAVERTIGQPFTRLLPRRYRPVWHSIAPHLSGRFGRRRQLSPPRTLAQAVHAADIVVASGGGYITDTWRWHATGVLGVLAMAQRLGKPTAMFGQGIGPIHRRALRLQARAVLPKLAILGLREGNMGRDLALGFGVPSNVVAVTGDDALELVQTGVGPEGDALGVNMRVTGYAGVDAAAAATVADVLAEVATVQDVPIVALPVSRHNADGDLGAIRNMFVQTHPRVDLVLRDLITPQDLAKASARCRAVVTGSYHAGVFGLAHGVPTVCLTRSSYYNGKFAGLKALFPHTCFVVSLEAPDFAERLRAAILQAWYLAPPLRAAAREAAADLRQDGRAAYSQFRDAVEKDSRSAVLPR
jgi:polysaccharide pyruvyl transferase WcaK-like protein